MICEFPFSGYRTYRVQINASTALRLRPTCIKALDLLLYGLDQIQRIIFVRSVEGFIE
ncbi:hypothetical protein HanXRQr2_Chr12g0538761 [Helianthus annuus]|uniref:Uncharacterized protein n=1 Tax=Helianthus annuus TaxID=4232 RepID=A0A9K3MVS2_HELAN|nr:hypothetical protein HanXRQr2_Chr12g0538761 [Helianthus annuus]KAJ0862467.1 hypothetical protein HanPSC8_Chr12g0518571 [Helianthus annuus]